MTTPRGHPDYQGYPVWTGPNMLPTGNLNLSPGNTTYGPFAVTQFAASRIRLSFGAGQATIFLNWWQDAAGTIGAGVETWKINANVGLDVVIVNVAPFASLTIDNTGGGNITGSQPLWAGSNATTGRVIYPVVIDDVTANPLSIPASGSAILRPGWIKEGPVYLYILPGDALGKLQFFLNNEDEAGGITCNLAGPITPTAEITRLLQTTARILALHVTNSDAGAAHSFQCILSVIEPG
jgi:hypothetical protein